MQRLLKHGSMVLMVQVLNDISHKVGGTIMTLFNVVRIDWVNRIIVLIFSKCFTVLEKDFNILIASTSSTPQVHPIL